MSKKVIVTKYNPNWKNDFELLKGRIISKLSNLVLAVEHVGSTSVEGLSAKPIIDLDVVIKDYSCFDEVKKLLADIGYIYEGDLGIKEREAFDYVGCDELPKHHLYVCPENSKELERHIAFRDFLRNNQEAMNEYGLIKEKAASLYPDDINGYINYKSVCIEKYYNQIFRRTSEKGE